MRLRRFFFLTTLAGLLALLPACSRPAAPAGDGNNAGGRPPGAGRGGPPGGGPGGRAEAPQGVPVEVAAAAIGPVAAFLSYNSTLEVETSVVVFPEVAGLVEKILVEEGDRVTAGQPLLELEHDEQRVDLMEGEANLAQLEQLFARTRELFEGGLVNRQEFDTREFEFGQARLRLERARLRVRQATVRAPVSGVITERFVQPGARVGGSTQLFGLMSLDEMVARVFVPGRHLATVSEGQEVYLSSEFLPGRVFQGWVKRISPIIDAASGTFKVTVGVRPDAATPPPGLFVNVRIVTDRRPEAVLVPKRAVVYEGGDRFVFVVRDGKAARIRLQAGYEEGEFIEATTGIVAGDPIVVLGQNALKDASPVRIVGDAVPSAEVAVPTRDAPSTKTAAATGS